MQAEFLQLNSFIYFKIIRGLNGVFCYYRYDDIFGRFFVTFIACKSCKP